MTKEELIVALKQVKEGTYMVTANWLGAKPKAIGDDQEVQHMEADALLVEYVNDPEIAAVYDDIPKWYA